MAPITQAMLQKRAEHNEGIVSTLKVRIYFCLGCPLAAPLVSYASLP